MTSMPPLPTTTLTLAPPTAEVGAVARQASYFTALAESLVVAGDAGMRAGTDALAGLKAMRKRADGARDALVRPLNAHVKMINDQFKLVSAPLDAAEREIKRKMLAYSAEQECARRAEAERAHREAQERALAEIVSLDEAGESVAAEVALSFAAAAAPEVARPEPVTTAAGASATVRKIWDFEPVDLRLVPVEFLALDEARVRAAVRAGTRDIPGIRIYQRDTLAVKG